ncbi:hypothetical protein C4J95_2891 [Pseudomonas orientalis]|uniref:hypothetical protein n=1 Tax=Pseudomonas fluorescens group TaxID=136843 RepID=UPI00078E4C3E|nr:MULTISPECIES: hypothetical protein [Pseudomonas fluorescens group]AMS20637.1 hypothetical protein AYK59_11000 [Pseudomonas synxantha]AZF00352.1 hypothetical protein C4J95_2891 [Pseudomonas orientalis]
MDLWKSVSRCLPASLVFKIALRRCRRAEEQLHKTAPPNTRAAESSGAIYEYMRESLDLFQERRSLISNNYRRMADVLNVPMPDFEDEKMWERIENDYTGRTSRTLTVAGELATIAIIREAQKHRREVRAFWLTWFTSLGGILIGIISVWKK